MKTTLILALAAVASVATAQQQTPPPVQTPPPTLTTPPATPNRTNPAQTVPPTQAAPNPGPTPQLNLPTTSATKPLQRSPNEVQLAALVAGRSITIDDATVVALLTNREFARAQSAFEAARARTSEARTGLNPTVGVGGQFVEYDRAINANFGDTTIPIAKQFQVILNTGVTLPLDIFGSTRAAIGQAQFSEIAARIDVNRTRNDVVFNVRNAFYNALRQQGNLVVAQDDLANAEARLREAQTSFGAGTGTQFDVLTAQRDVANAQGNVVNARGGVTIALGQLKNAMGIDVSTPMSIVDTGAVEDPGTTSTGTLATPQPEDFHTARTEVPLGPEYQSAVEEALRARPEVLEGNANVSAAERGVTYARRSLLPTFSVGVNYNVQPYYAGFTPANLGSVALNFNVPIYDGGVARARVREARATVAQAETDRRTAVDQVTLDVQQAYVNLQQSQERVRVATIGVQQAREAFRLAQLRARAGVSAAPQQSPQIELSNAQVSLTQAETNRVNALYDFNVARSALDRARGRFSYGSGGGYTQPPTAKETGRATPTTP